MHSNCVWLSFFVLYSKYMFICIDVYRCIYVAIVCVYIINVYYIIYFHLPLLFFWGGGGKVSCSCFIELSAEQFSTHFHIYYDTLNETIWQGP